MDYTKLITALKENDSQEVNRLVEAIRPRLIAFLCIHMNATKEDAKDCAQDSLMDSLEVFKDDRLNNPKQIVSYILSTCRNNYLKMQKKRRETSMDEVSEGQIQEPRQLQSLLDEEQKKLLEICMEQLKEKYQKFMQFWFDHPDYQTKKVAAHFDISVNNAWTRKHRLVKKLNECYTKKSKL